MQIKCSELSQALRGVLPGVASRELFDQANKVAFKNGRLISYNDAISISYPLVDSANNPVPFEGAIDGRRLADLLSKIDAETMVTLTTSRDKLEVEYDKTETVVIDGATHERQVGTIKAKFELPPVALPLEEIDYSGDYQDLPANFTSGLAKVNASCSRELSRRHFTCVKLGGKTLYACDGYRVARLDFDPAQPDLPDILLPVIAAEQLVSSGFNVTQVAISDQGDWGRFMTLEGVEFCVRLPTDCVYPIAKILKALEIDGRLITLPVTLVGPVERARIFAKREHRIDEKVMLTLRKKSVVLNAECEGIQFEEIVRDPSLEIEAKFDIHPEFLLETLGEGSMIRECRLGKDRIGFIGDDWSHVIGLRNDNAATVA